MKFRFEYRKVRFSLLNQLGEEEEEHRLAQRRAPDRALQKIREHRQQPISHPIALVDHAGMGEAMKGLFQDHWKDGTSL